MTDRSISGGGAVSSSSPPFSWAVGVAAAEVTAVGSGACEEGEVNSGVGGRLRMKTSGSESLCLGDGGPLQMMTSDSASLSDNSMTLLLRAL